MKIKINRILFKQIQYLFSCLLYPYVILCVSIKTYMTILEKYPENISWDLNIPQNKNKSIQWILTKADNVYTFTRSRINDKYVYIQKNDGKLKAYKEYEARYTYQRLFDEGYLLAAVP